MNMYGYWRPGIELCLKELLSALGLKTQWVSTEVDTWFLWESCSGIGFHLLMISEGQTWLGYFLGLDVCFGWDDELVSEFSHVIFWIEWFCIFQRVCFGGKGWFCHSVVFGGGGGWTHCGKFDGFPFKDRVKLDEMKWLIQVDVLKMFLKKSYRFPSTLVHFVCRQCWKTLQQLQNQNCPFGVSSALKKGKKIQSSSVCNCGC